MTDPASLVLGITPLLLGAINAYGAIYAKCKAYQQYAKLVLRLQRQLETQRCLFRNECHFLLRLVIADERTIQSMLANAHHGEWGSGSIDQQLRKRLDGNYDTCVKIVEDICDRLEDLEQELKRFDSIPLQRRQV